MEDYCDSYSASIKRALDSTAASEQNGTALDMGRALVLLGEWARGVRAAGRTLHFVGNGASACMASHMAVDWSKNAGVNAIAYNDVAFLTAIGNDLGYDQVFAQPVSWFGRAGDLLVTISSSGNSPNVVQAISAARAHEMRVVTFSGMKPENASRSLGDLNFHVPAWTYGIVECAHQVLLHAWLDSYMGVRDWELTTPQVIPPVAR